MRWLFLLKLEFYKHKIRNIILLSTLAISFALALSISILQESFYKGSALASAGFDLVIVPKGDRFQQLFEVVFLQSGYERKILSKQILQDIKNDKRVEDFSPIAFGDMYKGHPIVGVNKSFAQKWGKLKIRDGEVFADTDSAIIGAKVNLELEHIFSPVHADSLTLLTQGLEETEKAQSHDHAHNQDHESHQGHQEYYPHGHEKHVHGPWCNHEEKKYKVVGKMPSWNSPWDNAILVDVHSVWDLHSAASHGTSSAIIIKAKNIAHAYSLRAEYKNHPDVDAFSAAEVLAELNFLMGDVGKLLKIILWVVQFLVITSAILTILTALSNNKKDFGIMRALGASKKYILLNIWFYTNAVLVMAAFIAIILAWIFTQVLTGFLQTGMGISLPVTLQASEFLQVFVYAVVASLASLIPTLISYKKISLALR